MTELPAMTLRVHRGSDADNPRFDEFQVPYEDGASVLDALVWIRSHVDTSLAIRFSCFNANACKECMVLVDGKVRYGCTERLHAGTMTIEPLANKRLIRDLVTEITPPKERLSSHTGDGGD